MHSARVANGETGSTTGGDMRRLRRRGRLATGIGGAGFVVTLIIAIADTNPGNGNVISEVSLLFLLLAFGGFMTLFGLWFLTQSAEHAQMIWNLRDRASRFNDERATAAASSSYEPRRDALR